MLKCLKARHTISFNEAGDFLESQASLLSMADLGQNQLAIPVNWVARSNPCTGKCSHRSQLQDCTWPLVQTLWPNALHNVTGFPVTDLSQRCFMITCDPVACSGRMSNSAVSRTAYIIAGGAFLMGSYSTPFTPPESIISELPLSVTWHR